MESMGERVQGCSGKRSTGTRRVSCLLMLVLTSFSATGATHRVQAQTVAHKGWVGSGLTIDPWWKGAVFYELDPLTFQDSNGDGFGDLRGIAERLDYLKTLGVDALVLSPFELQKGAGSAFEAVYGKEEDFDQLEREASLRTMRVLVDVPIGPKHSTEDTLAMARFWLSRGVGGLRLVADSAPGGVSTGGTSTGGTSDGTGGQAEAAERVRLLRRLCASYVGDRVLLWDVAGELPPSEEAHTASGRRHESGSGSHQPVSGSHQPVSGSQVAQLTVDHAAASLTAWNAGTMRMLVAGAQSSNAMMVSDSADGVRSWTRLSGGMDQGQRLAVAKMVATALFAGREAPMMLSGQEIGMASDAASPAPMQWGAEPGLASGFTTGTPWVPMGPNAASATVAAEDAEPGSLLNWYRKLSELRKQGFALKGGSLMLVDTGYPDVVAWVRKGSTAAGERPLLVMCNLSSRGVLISVEQQLKQLGLKPASGMMPMALSFPGINPSYTATGINLPAYGIYLGEILQPGLEDAPAPFVSRRRGR
jgi:hypothetical protein